MNKKRLKCFVVLQILCLGGFFLPLGAQGYAIKKIVIDAGHGGNDPGAVGNISKEKDIVLSVALLTGQYVNKYLDDVEVIYTRKDDTYVNLNERAKIANKAKADLFVSIHANAATSTRAYGAETFVLGTNKNEANLRIAQKENAVITFEEDFKETYNGFDPNSPESYIIFNFMQNAYLEQSTHLASLLQEQYTKRVGRKDREVQQAPFLVLAATSMPSVLTELGFISNAEEERFLVSKKGQEYMASAIFRAIRDYKKEIEAKQSLSMTKANEKVAAVEELPKKTPEIIYKLQIFSSSKILKNKHRAIRDLENASYYTDGNSYKYTIGHSPKIEDIKTLKKKYNKTYEGCFIVAFQDNKRISIAEAQKIQAGK